MPAPARQQKARCAVCGWGGAGRQQVGQAWVCRNTTACLARRDHHIAAVGEYPVPAPPDVDYTEVAMSMSQSYAAEALGWHYGIRSDEVIDAMAAYMDEAWFAAAQEFMVMNDTWLKAVAEYPRECWCGQWPPLGTGCFYHGNCRCLHKSSATYGIGYRWGPIAGYVHGSEEEPVIPLPGDCPVHPGRVVPREHVHRLQEHLRRHRDDDFIPPGRPAEAV
jgi:hypothetical protein